MLPKIKKSLIFLLVSVSALTLLVNKSFAGTFTCEKRAGGGRPGRAICALNQNNCGVDEEAKFSDGKTCLTKFTYDTCEAGPHSCKQNLDPNNPNCLQKCLEIPGNTRGECARACDKNTGGTGGTIPGDPDEILVNLNELIDTSLKSRGFKFAGAFSNLGSFLSALLPLLYVIAGFILFLMLIAGGFKYLMSAGDAKKTESAKGTLTAAVIGFVLIFVAYWLTQLLTFVFSLKDTTGTSPFF